MSNARAVARDVLNVAIATFRIDRLRSRQGPDRTIATVRSWGRQQPDREEGARRRLQRIIRVIDAVVPGKPNCYRRALVQMSLDPEAAEQPLRLGIMAAGGPRSGHAWLPHEQQGADRGYDAEFVV